MNIKDYEIIFGYIERKYGNGKAHAVEDRAREIYRGFQGTIASAEGKLLKSHVTLIAEKCAVYLALKEYFPEKAYKWIDRAAYIKFTKDGKTLDKLASLKGGSTLFIKAAGFIRQKMFDEAAGFKTEAVRVGKDVCEFNILECPYCRYCAEFGCAELTGSFCDSDEYVYGNIRNVTFTRTKTLGKGGDCCDFRFEAKNKKAASFSRK